MALLRTTALFLLAATAQAQVRTASESQVKAVFLFNLAHFVDFPGTAWPDSQAPLVIGVFGNGALADVLVETVRGERAQERTIEVRRFSRVEDAAGCQILFIDRSQSDRIGEIRAGIRNRPILVVSDADGFVEDGGMVGMVTERGRLRLRIRPLAARAVNLTISSKLLRMADIVGETGS